jgi:hypothetical protein
MRRYDAHNDEETSNYIQCQCLKHRGPVASKSNRGYDTRRMQGDVASPGIHLQGSRKTTKKILFRIPRSLERGCTRVILGLSSKNFSHYAPSFRRDANMCVPMWGFKFSRRCLWRLMSSEICCREVRYMFIDVSEGITVSILRVKYGARQVPLKRR